MSGQLKGGRCSNCEESSPEDLRGVGSPKLWANGVHRRRGVEMKLMRISRDLGVLVESSRAVMWKITKASVWLCK